MGNRRMQINIELEIRNEPNKEKENFDLYVEKKTITMLDF